MKKLLLLPMLALSLLLTACGGAKVVGTDVSLNEIRDEMADALSPDSAIRPDSDYREVLYGITPELCAEAAALIVPGETFSREIVLVKAADEAAAARIRDLLESHLDAIREQTRNYDPAGFAVAEKAKVETDGLYVWLLLSDRAEELGRIFSGHRKSYDAQSVPVYTPEPTAVLSPTPAPTPSPTPAPTDEPAPTPVPWGLVPESDPAEDSWFDDALVIGNSVAHNLDTYVQHERYEDGWPTCMGKAQFFAGDYYSFKNASLHTGTQPLWKGRYVSVEELIAETGAKKVYLVFPHVDLIFLEATFEETIERAEALIDRIQAGCPDVTIFMVSMTPRNHIMEVQALNSQTIPVFNQMLLELTERKGCYYLDCFTPLADENGFLPPEFTAETTTGGIHLTYKGCAVWLDYLYRHTADIP